jgi:gas vesicle protein
MTDNGKPSISYLLLGIGIGCLIGILYAPQSGEESREFLSSKATAGQDYAQEKVRELRKGAKDLFERSQEIMMYHRGSISAALAAGKVAYQRESSGRVARAS